MPSSLSSTATQSIIHRRNQKSADGWAGEEVEVVVEISPNIPCRIDWVEGAGNSWDVWVFEENHDFREGDIFIASSVSAPLVVTRVSSWDDLRGNWHHYEIKTDESEATVAQVTP